MLQKKSAFDVLMNKNKTANGNNVSPSSASSALTLGPGCNNVFSPIKAAMAVSDAMSPVQKENDPPSSAPLASPSLTKKGRNLLEETITLDSPVASPVQTMSEEAKKKPSHSFFQKREKPVKTNSDSPIVLDAAPEMIFHPPVHIHQYSGWCLGFILSSALRLC